MITLRQVKTWQNNQMVAMYVLNGHGGGPSIPIPLPDAFNKHCNNQYNSGMKLPVGVTMSPTLREYGAGRVRFQFNPSLYSYLIKLCGLKSTVKGIVRFRGNLSSRSADTSKHYYEIGEDGTSSLWMYPISSSALLLSQDALQQLINILQAVDVRWKKVLNKEGLAVPVTMEEWSTSIEKFTSSATGQSGIHIGDAYELASLLVSIPSIVSELVNTRDALAIHSDMMIDVNANNSRALGLSGYYRIEDFSLPGLGKIFQKPRPALGNLMETFTKSPVMQRMIGAKTVKV